MSSRSEHLKWCKDRALEYVVEDDLAQAFASFQSDMSKHAETVGHEGLEIGKLLFFSGRLASAGTMREWIVGFN